MAINTQIATSSPPASMPCKLCQKWGAPCQFCVHPAPPLFTFGVKNGQMKTEIVIDIRRREKIKKEQQEKEEAENINKEDSAHKEYYPPSPIYDPNFKEDTMPAQRAKKKDLDSNDYPPNYMPKYADDAPTLVNNLVAPPTKTKEENKGEDTKEENKRQYTEEEEEDKGESKGGKMQTEDSGQEADDEDYSDYSNSDYTYLKSAKKKNIRPIFYNNL